MASTTRVNMDLDSSSLESMIRTGQRQNSPDSKFKTGFILSNVEG